MYTISRYFKSSLKRSSQILMNGNQRVMTRSLLLQMTRYSKSDDDKGKLKKEPREGIQAVDALEGQGEKVSGKTSKGKLNAAAEPKIELRIMPALYSKLGYDERNMKLGRELSPHLGIYKIQLTSVMSIFLRISGFILAIGIWIIGLSGLCCDLSVEALAEKIEKCELSSKLFSALKFFVVLPFAYHMVAGTRHLIWYLNVFLSLPAIYATGYVAIALTLLVASGLTILSPKKKDEYQLSKVVYHHQIESEFKNLAKEIVDISECDEQPEG